MFPNQCYFVQRVGYSTKDSGFGSIIQKRKETHFEAIIASILKTLKVRDIVFFSFLRKVQKYEKE